MDKRTVIFITLIVIILAGSLLGIKKFARDKSVMPQSVKEEAIIFQELAGYPKATLVSSSGEGEEVKAISKIWETTDPVNLVSAFYENELEQGAWQITANINRPEFVSYSFEKGEISGFIGIVKKDKAVTVINLTLGVK